MKLDFWDILRTFFEQFFKKPLFFLRQFETLGKLFEPTQVKSDSGTLTLSAWIVSRNYRPLTGETMIDDDRIATETMIESRLRQ